MNQEKLKEDILQLRAEGKSYNEIRKITGASKGTISYHCGEGQKEKAVARRSRSDRSLNHDLVEKSLERTCQNESCGAPFRVEKKSDKKRFCSRRCGAIVNNPKYPRTSGPPRGPRPGCLECGVPLASKKHKYCSEHSLEFRRKKKIENWLSGEWPGGTEYGLSTIIRAYLLEQSDYKCSKCKFNTPHPDDGKTILEINHINGDGTDHSKENLEVVCPNCHALTSNYRARNMGKGRPHYYLRVSKA